MRSSRFFSFLFVSFLCPLVGPLRLLRRIYFDDSQPSSSSQSPTPPSSCLCFSHRIRHCVSILSQRCVPASYWLRCRSLRHCFSSGWLLSNCIQGLFSHLICSSAVSVCLCLCHRSKLHCTTFSLSYSVHSSTDCSTEPEWWC